MATGFSVMDALNKNSKAGVEDSSPKAKFRTKDLSIFKIYANEGNFYPQEAIEQKAGEILALGLLENLVVKYEPLEGTGEFKLISGERRWRALCLLVKQGYKEFEFVTCNIIAPATSLEERIALIIANSHRSKSMETMIKEEQELKVALEDMKANGIELKGYDLQSGRLRNVIAELLNISKTKVAQIEAVSNNLIPEFMEELNKNRLTFSAAYELSGMTSEEQREALAVLADTGELTYQRIKEMKEAKQEGKEAAQVDDQMEFNEQGECAEKAAGQLVSESDTDVSGEDSDAGFSGMNEPEAAGEGYQTPHPDGITSICYSCTEYETCNVKTGTCTTCDQYKNRTEVYKTDEQRYTEEQERIDKETARKLRERADNDKMENLPSATQEYGQRIHQIRIGASFFEDARSNRKSFELRKNDRGYKEGDILEMMEYDDGRNTGRIVRKLVTYLLEDFAGLEDGYCIMATDVLRDPENKDENLEGVKIVATIGIVMECYGEIEDMIRFGNEEAARKLAMDAVQDVIDCGCTKDMRIEDITELLLKAK